MSDHVHACPDCGSGSTQSVSVAWARGTRISDFGGVGFSGGGRVGLFGGVSSSQSLFAQRLAPPSRKRSDWMILAAVISFFLALFLFGGAIAGQGDSGSRVWCGLLGAALGGAGWAAASTARTWRRWNREIYPRLRAQWGQAWVCDKCGTLFKPAASSPPPADDRIADIDAMIEHRAAPTNSRLGRGFSDRN